MYGATLRTTIASQKSPATQLGATKMSCLSSRDMDQFVPFLARSYPLCVVCFRGFIAFITLYYNQASFFADVQPPGVPGCPGTAFLILDQNADRKGVVVGGQAGRDPEVPG